jgi:hypothetical protein
VTADEADAGSVFLLVGDEAFSDGGFFFMVAATNLRTWSKSCRNGFVLGSTVPSRTRPLKYRTVHFNFVFGECSLHDNTP